MLRPEIKWPSQSQALVVYIDCDAIRYARYQGRTKLTEHKLAVHLPPELVELYRVRPEDFDEVEPEAA